MQRVKYLAISPESRAETIEETGKIGFLLVIGNQGGNTMAFVQDGATGQVVCTYPEYVRFMQTDMDVLMQRLITEMKGKVARSRQLEVEQMIVDLFKQYAW
jgi:hypothetical protein